MHPFRKLLLVSMGRESSFEKDLTHVEWAKMYNMAKIQTLLGVLNDGIHRLPAFQLRAQVLCRWLIGCYLASLFVRQQATFGNGEFHGHSCCVWFYPAKLVKKLRPCKCLAQNLVVCPLNCHECSIELS